MTPLRQRMLEDMQLRGLAERTQESYVGAVRQFARHFGRSPDQITEEEVRQYFLYLKNEKKASRSACTIALCALKFFYEQTLGKEWKVLGLIRPPRERSLPVVLSQEEVRRILGCLHLQHHRVCLSTIYSCGLRLKEGVYLQVANIDSSRRFVHIQGGKRRMNRYIPLPQPTLDMLRRLWVTQRHPKWLFPASLNRRGTKETTRETISPRSVQRAFKGR